MDIETILTNLRIGLYSICIYSITNFGYSLIKEFKKYIKKLRFFIEFKNSKDNYETKSLYKNDYILICGTAKKIFFRLSYNIDQNIILSESNSTYYEDFLLSIKENNFLIRPYPGTLLGNLPNFYKKFNFSSINAEDKLSIFGKIVKNKSDLPLAYQNLQIVKAKYITGTSINQLILKVLERQFNKIYTSVVIVVIYSIFLYFEAKYFIIPEIKSFRNKINYITKIYCNECNTNLCNLICEKCKCLAEYCDNCYINLQNKIDKNEIQLESVKCKCCLGVLDRCTLLLCNN